MHVLIVGLGSIGKRHARNFKTLGVEQLSGVDPDATHAAEFVRQTGGNLFHSYEEALASCPDLVVIASPNRLHLQQALQAACAGLPLFIEKPLGTDLAMAERLLAEVRARKLYVHVGSNWKFHPAFIHMKELLRSGALGHLVAIQVLAGQWLPDWHPWEDFRHGYSARKDLGGGAIFDTHELDYMIWLMDDAVSRFHGLKRHDPKVLPIETEHVAVAVMEMANGVLCTLQTDYVQRRAQRRYFMTGTEGSLEWDLHAGGIILHGQKGEDPQLLPVALDDLNEMYIAQSKRILDDLATGNAPMTPLEHMIEILRLQLAWHAQHEWRNTQG